MEGIRISYVFRKQNKHVFLEDSTISVIEIGSHKKNKNIFQDKITLDVNSYNRAMHESSLFVGNDCCSVCNVVVLGFALTVSAFPT